MMRNKVSSALQKTYDECYLICSTAVYFEGQGNEAEALRSWRSALDQIYYHNAYKIPPGYIPKSETEKSLKDSLKDMEIRCKERVDLLQALKQSREEEMTADTSTDDSNVKVRKSSKSKQKQPESPRVEKGFIGNGTVPAMELPELNRTGRPPLPQRPTYIPRQSSEYAVVGKNTPHSPSRLSLDSGASVPSSAASLQPPHYLNKTSRSPSPEKGRTMLHTLRNPDKNDKKASSKPSRSSGAKKENPLTNQAAAMAWQSGTSSGRDRLGRSLETGVNNSTTTLPDGNRKNSHGDTTHIRASMSNIHYNSETRTLVIDDRRGSHTSNPSDYRTTSNDSTGGRNHTSEYGRPSNERKWPGAIESPNPSPRTTPNLIDFDPITQPMSVANLPPPPPAKQSLPQLLPYRSPKPSLEPVAYPSYLQEYPETSAKRNNVVNGLPLGRKPAVDDETQGGRAGVSTVTNRLSRKPVSANISSPRYGKRQHEERRKHRKSKRQNSEEDNSSPSYGGESSTTGTRAREGSKQKESPLLADPITPSSDESEVSNEAVLTAWDSKVTNLMKNLPKGVDAAAAKQIFNEIVVQGDEVHWEDVAGLDAAKKALKEAVVYPFLRPDLFMGLREPARGMLLFGPPGTGKTMLARAVATESRSTFFSISASSLTSKFLGESEKLVRALFSIAKALAPSIIFVDEIDSLLSTRSNSGEHEATRRIKTEFLIQWSDLQRAAAGREQSDKEKERGDASRVLVLAATNLPWAIDEAARRRFVRRQYIPLPEDETRATQLRTLLGHQKHSLDEQDIQRLVYLTDGFSGSDITALAKDAAMGPLRSLGEKLLEMSMEDIRPIHFVDFEASLVNIRPSVSKQGLKEFEDWAREFGERGG